MRNPAILLPLLIGACASSVGSSGTGAATTSAETIPCSVEVAIESGRSWHQVEGEGFTFCVPSDWRRSGPRTWRGGGGSVTWHLGESRREVRSEVVTVRAGEVPPPPKPSARMRRSMVIGGATVEVWQNESNGRHRSGASWSHPIKLRMIEEAPTASTADLQVAVYRTVRFTPK